MKTKTPIQNVSKTLFIGHAITEPKNIYMGLIHPHPLSRINVNGVIVWYL